MATLPAVIHHVSIDVVGLERSSEFYDSILGPLGWRRLIDNSDQVAWGMVKPAFYISTRHPAAPGGGHVAFVANSIPAVKASWEQGIENGGTDDGPPGQRPERGATYYSAYLLDPDGNRVEVVVGAG